MSNAILCNEGKLCDAAVKIIEQRTGQTRNTDSIRRPEKDGEGPPVELRLIIGTQELAIEHTRIEPFEGEIGKGVALERLVDPVKRALRGKLPGPAIYTMYFPPDRVLSGSKSNLKEYQDLLTEWVLQTAPLLYRKIQERNESRLQDELTAKLCGFRYEIRFSCVITGDLCDQTPGCFGSGRWAPEGLEALTTRRLRRALCDKLPKLRDCKDDDARTVLVLESDNVSLIGPECVGDALNGLQGEFAAELPFPDEIYFADTTARKGSWAVWPMKLDSKCWSWEALGKYTEFRGDKLTDLNPK
jgi:hypothetical protein